MSYGWMGFIFDIMVGSVERAESQSRALGNLPNDSGIPCHTLWEPFIQWISPLLDNGLDLQSNFFILCSYDVSYIL